MCLQLKKYSLTEHLASIAGGPNWRKVNLAAFTAYFDASGDDHSQPVLSVAGFVANADNWKSFEAAWLKRLLQDGLEYFHTKEFNGCSGQFKSGWKGDEDRQRKLITDLVLIIRDHVGRKFGMTVINKQLKGGFTADQQERWHVCAYSLAGRTCAARVREWFESWHARSMPEFVFEDGDSGKGKLIDIFKNGELPDPIFKPKKSYVDRRGMVHEAAIPLQAADLLAYECFDPTRKIVRDGYLRKIKRTIEELHRIPGPLGIIEAPHMKFLVDAVSQAETQGEADVKILDFPKPKDASN